MKKRLIKKGWSPWGDRWTFQRWPKSVIESADDFSEEGDIADLEVQAWFVRDNDELEAFASE